MSFIRDLLSESGSISAMRVMALICVLAAVGVAMFGLKEKSDVGQISILCGIFLGAAFGGKVGQKFAETGGSSADGSSK